ncbi:CotH kinase family protein [bacterium]|nr:CotH kinase family protein [bacterium]MBU1633444.1 CotH kinase family protein [bacterium]MBU1874750.1 CotH kinase family protein [bacterium]
MSSNLSTIADEDGDYPDWIELYNAGITTVNLQNYGLTDNLTDTFKWIFPDINILPNDYLLLFASEKNRLDHIIHIETIIDWHDNWNYFIGNSEPPADWREISFDDSEWLVGASGFGYGDDDDATVVGATSPISVLIRKKFTAENINSILGMLFHVDYDDGFVAYLNGAEIARANVGTIGIPPPYDTFADAPREAEIYTGGKPEEYRIQDFQSLLQDGENVLAVQVHNVQVYSSDMSLIPFLTLEMNSIPENPRGPAPILEMPIPKLHTNFKLSSSGEQLALFNPEGVLIDSLTFEQLPADYSYGRKPDGETDWYIFNQPSPGASNSTTGYQGYVEEPEFSITGGFYSDFVDISINSPAEDVETYYTLDGSTPTESSYIYTTPIHLESTTVLRASCFKDGYLQSKTITQSYLINTDFSLPVISLVTDSGNFFDTEIGIYVFGNDADTVNYPYWGSNFWEDWERPVHVELYEPDGQQGFSIDAGIKIYGSWSRLYPQKSLSVFARERYGYNKINYQIFPDLPINEYQAFILRNSGQDWGHTFFRDAMMQSLTAEATDVDVQAYRPAMVLLNGEIWGIHNIREKFNEHYIASHHGVDPDNIDMIERDNIIIHGDLVHYQSLIDFVENNDISLSDNYEYVRTQMDVENFLDYAASILYFAHSDWPWNNVKCWRPKTNTGRWKWMLFDTDYGFHCGHFESWWNTFDEMRNQDNKDTGTTLLFFKLMDNENCRNYFINRYADLLNTVFNSVHVVQRINEMKAGILQDMPYHIQKWQYSFIGPWWLGKSIDSMEEWYSHIQVAIDFGLARADYVREHIVTEFSLQDGGIGTLILDILPNNSGNIKINSYVIKTYPWSGKYFIQVPIQLTAIPRIGFKFAGWTGITGQDSQSVTINITDDQQITALFEPDSESTEPIVINEINYNSSSDFNTEDWIEFYNTTDNTIDLSGWIFQDSNDNHSFIFPAGTSLSSRGYIVICRDHNAFTQLFPSVSNYLGDFNFGLSSDGELVRLCDAQGNFVDSLIYGVQSSWPTEPNGNGPTLALKDPCSDNSLPDNWTASANHGTPGEINDVYNEFIESNAGKFPESYTLYQNYPNPFNSITNIRYGIPERSNVDIKIYDLLGREIITLICKDQDTRYYNIIWDAKDRYGNNVTSGIYLYRIVATSGDRMVVKAKKLLLLR